MACVPHLQRWLADGACCSLRRVKTLHAHTAGCAHRPDFRIVGIRTTTAAPPVSPPPQPAPRAMNERPTLDRNQPLLAGWRARLAAKRRRRGDLRMREDDFLQQGVEVPSRSCSPSRTHTAHHSHADTRPHTLLTVAAIHWARSLRRLARRRTSLHIAGTRSA
eukprot:5771324-Prymnesium_polylepis.2